VNCGFSRLVTYRLKVVINGIGIFLLDGQEICRDDLMRRRCPNPTEGFPIMGLGIGNHPDETESRPQLHVPGRTLDLCRACSNNLRPRLQVALIHEDQAAAVIASNESGRSCRTRRTIRRFSGLASRALMSPNLNQAST